VHQPLHNVAQYSKDFPNGEGDRGGNECKVNVAMSNVSSDITDLHKLWDSAGGKRAHDDAQPARSNQYFQLRLVCKRRVLPGGQRRVYAAVRRALRIASERAHRELSASVVQRFVHSKVQFYDVVARRLRSGRQLRLRCQLVDVAAAVQMHQEQATRTAAGTEWCRNPFDIIYIYLIYITHGALIFGIWLKILGSR
jgi:hypothetical protein